MKRKTNLFYTSGYDSKFLTFSNYTELLTGNFLSTNTKLFPSRFIALLIKNLNENSKRNIIRFLSLYYESKLSVCRDELEKNQRLPEDNMLSLNYLLEALYCISEINDDYIKLTNGLVISDEGMYYEDSSSSDDSSDSSSSDESSEPQINYYSLTLPTIGLPGMGYISHNLGEDIDLTHIPENTHIILTFHPRTQFSAMPPIYLNDVDVTNRFVNNVYEFDITEDCYFSDTKKVDPPFDDSSFDMSYKDDDLYYAMNLPSEWEYSDGSARPSRNPLGWITHNLGDNADLTRVPRNTYIVLKYIKNTKPANIYLNTVDISNEFANENREYKFHIRENCNFSLRATITNFEDTEGSYIEEDNSSDSFTLDDSSSDIITSCILSIPPRYISTSEFGMAGENILGYVTHNLGNDVDLEHVPIGTEITLTYHPKKQSMRANIYINDEQITLESNDTYTFNIYEDSYVTLDYDMSKDNNPISFEGDKFGNNDDEEDNPVFYSLTLPKDTNYGSITHDLGENADLTQIRENTLITLTYVQTANVFGTVIIKQNDVDITSNFVRNTYQFEITENTVITMSLNNRPGRLMAHNTYNLGDSSEEIVYEDVERTLIPNFDNDIVTLKYISDITEQDYNGTFTDTICVVDLNEYRIPYIHIATNEDYDDNNIEFDTPKDNETQEDCIYGWENGTVDIYNNYNSIFDYTNGDKSQCRINSFIDKLDIKYLNFNNPENVEGKETSLEFNCIIPLFDIVNSDFSKTETTIVETDEILLSKDLSNNEDEMYAISKLYNMNVPLGIWLYTSGEGEEIDNDGIKTNILKLYRDNETGFSQSWSLTISSQFKPFPYSKSMPNEICTNSESNAFMTFAQVLSNQNTLINKFNEISYQFSYFDKRLADLKSQINNVGTLYNIDNIHKEMRNLSVEMKDEYADFQNKIYAYINNLRWKATE